MLVLRRPCEILAQYSLLVSPSEMKAKRNHRREEMSCNLLAFTYKPKDDRLELNSCVSGLV